MCFRTDVPLYSEYQDLIAFLGRKFEGIDRPFEEVATKEELRSQQAETRRHMGVLVEAVRDDI